MLDLTTPGYLFYVSANHILSYSNLLPDSIVDDVTRNRWLMHATSVQGNATNVWTNVWFYRGDCDRWCVLSSSNFPLHPPYLAY